MYNEKVMDIFKEAKNAGIIRGASGVGTAGNASCGDIMKIYLKVEGDIIKEAKFKTFGCVAAIASSDVACDLIMGKTIEAALKVTNKDVLDVLGKVPAQKVHCSVLAKEAIHDAVADFKKRQAKEAKKKK